MKNVYRIYPIVTDRINIDKGTLTYRYHHGENALIPAYAWLIKGEKKPFLIDTGFSVKEAGKLTSAFVGEEGKPIEDSLQEMGISMSDIETIIMTHMHLDHFLNAKKFPNATIVVQEEELRFARNPHPMCSTLDKYKWYNREWYTGLNFETVKGDTEIFPGVEAVYTPGHSPGTQSISINTTEGKVVIVGFCSSEDNFSDEGDIISGVHTNIFTAYDSMVRLREIGGTKILPHSERFVSVESIP